MRHNDITVILGRKWCGKSTRARALAMSRPRRIVIDPMFEHEELGAVCRSFDALVSYLRLMRAGPYGLVFRSLDDYERDMVVNLTTAGSPDVPPLPGVTVLIDEIDRICSPSSITPGLKRLVNYGRHFGVSLIALARRPRAIHHDLTSQADRMIIGQMQEPADVDYLRKFIGLDLAARVKALREPDQFVVWPDDLADVPAGDPPPPPPPGPAQLELDPPGPDPPAGPNAS